MAANHSLIVAAATFSQTAAMIDGFKCGLEQSPAAIDIAVKP